MVKLFSKETLTFLERHSKDVGLDLTRLPTSSSQLNIGDIITFNYYGEGYNGASRIALVVYPVTRAAGTGNRLLTVVNISPSMTLTPEVVNNLYKNRSSLGSEDYRTFILNNKVKNIFRIETLSQMKEDMLSELEEGMK